MRIAVGLAASLALCAACGDPLAPGDFEGEPLLAVNGLVCAVGTPDAESLAIGVVWKQFGPKPQWYAGDSAPIGTLQLPATFHLSLYGSLSAGMATTTSGDDDVAVGIPVLYDDLDGDGVMGLEDDRILGASATQVILHVADSEQPVGPVSLSVPELPAGYHLAEVLCDDSRNLVGFSPIARTARVDVWLTDEAIDGVEPTEELAPESCLSLF